LLKNNFIPQQKFFTGVRIREADFPARRPQATGKTQARFRFFDW